VTRKRVLVADDDSELLALLARIIQRLGVEVVTAQTGGDLLDRLAEQGPFDLVITDVSMPWMTGLQVMHSARAAGMECPVIVMTALRNHKTAFQVESLGVEVKLLYKPFTVAEMETAVLAVVGAPGLAAPPAQGAR
jgi:CheY-like chemotaxis protein